MPRTRTPWSHPAFTGAAATSAAARPGRATTTILQEKILEHLTLCGEQGATQEELEQVFAGQYKPQSVRTRTRELYDMGKVRAAGFTRPTTSGNPAKVWLAA
ncbi:hypothetical protein [Azospirillum sp. Sh1]|uniref:hypothetical protein n=1 Tax=Azospirillum sp. Sh1 TaxID=2607285 RepID=UPI0011EDDF69|nr:hypothetical protein [Azospirillum sp. Sh1]KAA0573433.1 hypothetical protein FZ029_20865 [Azospirillum sp. Sh1]